MTYCVGIKVQQGIVMISDSRTNAGVDNVSTYSKMWRYGVAGQRQFVICSAGNLATTQAVMTKIEQDMAVAAPRNLLNVKNMSEAAEYLGRVSVDAQNKNTGGGPLYEATFLISGEIIGAASGLYMVYAQGNFIAASTQKPFLQIGETKYGKPILDRVITPETSLESAGLCGLVSMDATTRSNLTVGPPIEMVVLEAGTLQMGRYYVYDDDDSFLRELRTTWNQLMKEAFERLEPLKWDNK